MKAVDVARIAWPGGKIAHCLYPPWEAREISSVSDPGSIGVAFSGQTAAVVHHEARAQTRLRDIPAGSVGLCGEEPIRWLRVSAPSDTIEITAHTSVRLEIAESMGVPRRADLDDMHGWFDPVILAVASRLRAAARGWAGISDLARDELVRSVYAHVYRAKFGGRRPSGRPRALSREQVETVAEVVREKLGDTLSIATLAEAVALSPFHFARSFKAATGLAPHRFVTINRLQRAHELLLHTPMVVADVAAAVGFSNVSHFRRMFRAQVGTSPSLLQQRSINLAQVVRPSHSA